MPFRIGDEIPNFEAVTQTGTFDFHTWLGGSWAILFSHPRDYTPVCTTELGEAARLQSEFDARGVKVIALSCDSVESHRGWIADIETARGVKVEFPIIADEDRTIATRFGMLDPEEKDLLGLPVTVRSVYILGPDKKIKAMIIYPPAIGRNFHEVLRAIDALQTIAVKPVATPVNWKPGDRVMIQPSVTAEDAARLFPEIETIAVPSGKGYLRTTADPKTAAAGGGGGGGGSA